MKKAFTFLLALSVLFCCISAFAENDVSNLDELISAAQKEKLLIVYGSCDESYLVAACRKFEELYNIKVEYKRLSTGKVQEIITKEAGNPSADVWFGGTNDPYSEVAKDGLLEAYDAKNAIHLLKESFKDNDGYWYGIYQGILGFIVNKNLLSQMNLDIPRSWDDLLKEDYKGNICLSNPKESGTAKLFVNTMVQMKGHENGMKYLVALDKNVAEYTPNGSGPSEKVGLGEYAVGVGFLHDGLFQILQECHDNIALIIPEEGTSYEIGSTAIFKGTTHPNAAKLWIEFALSPDCVELADDSGSYQFLVIDNAQKPSVLDAFPELDPNRTIEYDFLDAKENTSKYVEEYFMALEESGVNTEERFKIE